MFGYKEKYEIMMGYVWANVCPQTKMPEKNDLPSM